MVYATPVLMDINGDEQPDVIIGRRLRNGDLDGNGALDLVHVAHPNVLRLELISRGSPKVLWNQYRGPDLNGVVDRSHPN